MTPAAVSGPGAARIRTKPHYIHATAVLIGEAGLLIRGVSRSGKSSLALALLEEAARHGSPGKLIGDDRISIERQGDLCILRGHPAILGQIEKRGEGILSVPWETSGIARCVIDLEPLQETPSVSSLCFTQIEGIELPLLRLPSGNSRATLVMGFLRDIRY